MEPLTITAGGRFDHYFDVGSSFNPRIAAVYNLFDNHIFKIQYSRAFRPPTFLELYIRNNIVAEGNENISPETIQSVEAGYIYHNVGLGTNIRFTTYYSHMDDLIKTDSSKNYENLDSVLSRGLEVEVSQKLNELITVSANGSYVNIKDKTSNEPLPNIANIYGYAKLSYQPIKRMTLTLSDQYVGKRKREKGDTRSSLGDYHVFNAIATVNNVMVKQASINFGIKNLLDQEVLHPSPLVSFGNPPAIVPSYAGDYPRPGRELWLNFVYEL
jgi:iron complex outermembrane receptor protein